MSADAIATLSTISRDEPQRTTFNSNFKGTTILTGNVVLTSKVIGPLAVSNLDDMCAQHKKDPHDILFAVYNDRIVHLIFKDNTSFSVVLTKYSFSFIQTNSDKSTWARLQNFYYGHTNRTVSHAKKAPVIPGAGMTLDQAIVQYNSNILRNN